MSTVTFQNASRLYYETVGKIDREDLKTGAMLRIAEATEAMAVNHNKLLADIRYHKKNSEMLRQDLKVTSRSLTSTKGVVTKMKREREALKQRIAELESKQ